MLDDILYYISKYIKTILIVVGSITAIISAFLLFTFTSHKIASNSEYEYLVNNGFINKYSAGEYELNIYRPGNPESKYKIIGLSDINENNFAQRMEQVNKQLMDYDLIYIDRAGYGYSDDTDVPQTVEQVVNDYRTALKSAGINPPYVLMPHEYGGIFAVKYNSTASSDGTKPSPTVLMNYIYEQDGEERTTSIYDNKITNEDGSYTVNLSNSITYNTNKQYTYTYDDITSYVCDMYTTYEYDNFIERVSYSYQGNLILDNIGYAYEFYYDKVLYFIIISEL